VSSQPVVVPSTERGFSLLFLILIPPDTCCHYHQSRSHPSPLPRLPPTSARRPRSNQLNPSQTRPILPPLLRSSPATPQPSSTPPRDQLHSYYITTRRQPTMSAQSQPRTTPSASSSAGPASRPLPPSQTASTSSNSNNNSQNYTTPGTAVDEDWKKNAKAPVRDTRPQTEVSRARLAWWWSERVF
jgi:hypothetical protein